MSRSSTVRRAVAEIRWDEGSRSVAWVGDRSIHHYWTLLSAYFRDVLLPPLRRAEEDGVSWSWREDEEPAPVSASELRSLRKALAEEQQLFAESLAGGGLGRRGQAAGLKGQMNVEQLGTVMAGVVSKLVERSDDALRGYVCRTESGLRVHSWGADAPACPTYPDTSGLEIAGRVLVGGKPARHDVVLESSDGETITEVPSDDSGEFRFSKLSAGEYRLRARTLRGTFPPHGLAVTLGRQSVSDLVLADARAETVSPLVSARRRSRQRSYRTPALAALLVLGAAGGVWWWRTQPADTAAPVAAAPATVPESASSSSANLAPGSLPATAGSRPGPARTSITPAASPASAVGVAPSLVPSVAGVANPSSSALPVDTPLPVEGHLSSPVTLTSALAGLPGAAKGQPAAAGAVPPAGSGGTPATPGANGGSPGGGGAGATTAPSAAANATAVASAANATSGGTSGSSSSSSVGSQSPATTPSAASTPAAAVAATATPTPEPKPTESPLPASAVALAVPPVVPPATPDPEPAPIAIRIPDTTTAAPAAAALPSSDAEGVAAKPEAKLATDATAPATSSSAATNPSSGESASAAAPASEANPSTPESPAPAAPLPTREVREAEAKSLLRAIPAALTRTVRVRVTPWRTRLLGDAILPTAPVPLRQVEAVSELRTRLLAEQDARMPGAFRAPRGRLGVVLEFAADVATDALTWVDDAGAPADRGTVGRGRAEIAWESGQTEQVFRLRRADRSVLAELRVTGSGREFTVRTTDDTRAWLQLVVASSGAEPAVSVLSWRTATAAPMPVSWRLLEAEALRAEAGVMIPLGSQSGAVALQGCALFDAGSGWALVSEVRQAADRPLGE